MRRDTYANPIRPALIGAAVVASVIVANLVAASLEPRYELHMVTYGAQSGDRQLYVIDHDLTFDDCQKASAYVIAARPTWDMVYCEVQP